MRESKRNEGGFSLVEISFGLVSATILALATFGMVKISRSNSEFVGSETKVIENIRKSGNVLAEDLRLTSRDWLIIEKHDIHDDVLKLKVPVKVENGQIHWGAKESKHQLKQDADSMIDSWVVYRVIKVPQRGKDDNYQLRRQVVGANGKVSSEMPVINWLKDKGRGFKVDASGTMYKVTIFARADQKEGKGEFRDMSFDVAVRN